MSFRNAINNKCKECIYDPYDKGTWREQTRNCTSPKCPLYNLRPKPLRSNLNENKAKLPLERSESLEVIGIDL